ncbi:MAG: sigma-70 family RNA polymerase sigma factor [Anaerolineae bacterium]|nr:sigma-70 family RNA polymerase sigma factor [Anaerolineae bacterium]
MSQTPILELLRRIQANDEEALVELHTQYANLVYSVAYRVLNDTMAAEEVTQDTFMRLWNKSHTFDPQKGNFVVWLLTITRRLAIDTLRQRTRQEPRPDTLFIDENPQLWENLLSSGGNDLRRTMLMVMQQLPPEQSSVISLAYFQGMSHSDIAAYLHLPLGTVKTRIRQGMQKLRDAWFNEKPINLKIDP